jgi:hypothetical protein
MPLNEKAALGGAANLERSSQGSLDNPPYKPSPTNSASHIHARPGARRCGRVGLAIAGLSIPSRADSARLAMGDPTHLWNARSIGFGGRCRRGRGDERA